jgi:transcription antitermination factor NusG
MSGIKRWYAIYTKPRSEKKVDGLLSQKGLESYCPLNKVTKRWSDRVKTVEEPLFKSYVFVRISDDDQTNVRMTQGVVNFVYWLGKPARVKDKEIEVIRRFLNEYENVIAEPLKLEANTKVRIKQGLFMDQEATVLKVQGAQVKIIIESIGYSLVALVAKTNVGSI